MADVRYEAGENLSKLLKGLLLHSKIMGGDVMGVLVKLDRISKRYSNKQILQDITLKVMDQQVISILGGNGTGKSTLLRLIAGLDRPSSGKVTYATNQLTIGYVPERFPKLIRFTPSEYLTSIGKMNGISAASLDQTIADYLERFRLNDVAHQRIHDLSKGNIQKVGIIQAIVARPDLLILDEPISGLDLYAQNELLLIIDELKAQGTTIILTYHEANMFENIVDTTYMLKDGYLSKTDRVERDIEQLKLIEITQIDDTDIEDWEGVVSFEKYDDQLILYVLQSKSNNVLANILQLQGNIHRVIDFDGGIDASKGRML